VEPRHIGRPTKFTQETKDKLLMAIRKGAPYELACNYARIDITTLYNWRDKAEINKEEAYIEFFKDLKEAEGITALMWLDKIDKAMDDGQWTAAAWKLERRHYKHFSSQAQLIDMNQRLVKLEDGESHEGNGSKERSQEVDQKV
jgi:hypothetical protein